MPKFPTTRELLQAHIKSKEMPKLAIGVDPGVNTGVGIKCLESGQYKMIKSMQLHEALFLVMDLLKKYELYIIVEDARLRTCFKGTGKERLQGAGSVKRDSKIWEEFLIDVAKDNRRLHFKMLAPNGKKTGLSHAYFSKIIKWNKRTNQHARDAAMLIVGMNEKSLIF